MLPRRITTSSSLWQNVLNLPVVHRTTSSPVFLSSPIVTMTLPPACPDHGALSSTLVPVPCTYLLALSPTSCSSPSVSAGKEDSKQTYESTSSITWNTHSITWNTHSPPPLPHQQTSLSPVPLARRPSSMVTMLKSSSFPSCSPPSPSSNHSRPLLLTWFQKFCFSIGHVNNDMCAAIWFTYLLVYLGERI